MRNDYLNMLGLAFRARQCSLGVDGIVKDIQHECAKLVLIANDCSPQTKKRLTDKCNTYNIPFVIVDDRDTLSHAMGQSQRVAVAILDKGFATKISSLLRYN